MSCRRAVLILGSALALTVCVAVPILAQEPEAPDTAAAPQAAPPANAADTLQSVADAAIPVRPRPVSPMGAFFRSLLIPGWGQVAVQQPERGAFYFAVQAGTLWMLTATQGRLNAAERVGDEALIAARQEQKEDWLVFAVFWALLSGVDGWVSAHMWDFEGAVVPPPDGSPGVAVQYSVPVGGP